MPAKSSWAGETDINSRSIGIEIVNGGHEFGYRDYPLRQIAAVISLCKSIITRRGPISADRILAHSDVAPRRKQDPGEKFPWGLLSESGIGHWVRAAPLDLEGHGLRPGDRSDSVTRLQRTLRSYGYGLAETGTYDDADARGRDGLPAPFPASARRWRRRPLDVADVAGAHGDAACAIGLIRSGHVELLNPVRTAALDVSPGTPHSYPVSRPDGRSAPMPKGGRGGKSGLHGQTVPDNVRRGQPQGQCHREQTASARCV